MVDSVNGVNSLEQLLGPGYMEAIANHMRQLGVPADQVNAFTKAPARSKDTYLVGSKVRGADAKSGIRSNGGAQVGPPSQEYNQKVKDGEPHLFTPLRKDGNVFFKNEEGKVISGRMSYKDFDAKMKEWEKNDPKGAKEFAEANGLENRGGAWGRVTSPDSNQFVQQLGPAVASNPIASTTSAFADRASWMAPMIGFAAGGIPGLVMGFIGAKVLQSAGGPSPAASHALGSTSSGFGSAALVGLGGFLGGGSTAAAALDGQMFRAKREMTSYAQEFKMDQLLAEINNPGVPIEDLIMIFMAAMADRYETKLRQKMEETARAEKREEQRQREKDKAQQQASMVAGVAGMAAMIPGIGTAIAMGGQMAGQMITAKADAQIQLNDALAGHSKSSTILMQEVQILMQKWKQVNELLSNLSKSLHDMAMTPIRNLR